jgi:CHAT domain-containing protein
LGGARRARAPRPELALRLVTNARHGTRARELDASLKELRLGDERLRALVQSFGTRAEVVTGEGATLASLRGAPPAGVLAFVTHGVHDPLRELSRGLVVTPGEGHDGVLFAGDVEQWIAAPLVILAACSSGHGPVRQGDAEMGTLTGAFLARGSHAVVATSADAAVEPTLVLVAHLCAELARGVAGAEALRRARLALHEAGWTDAHDHALVHFQGRW